jgi:hypothetical protein
MAPVVVVCSIHVGWADLDSLVLGTVVSLLVVLEEDVADMTQRVVGCQRFIEGDLADGAQQLVCSESPGQSVHEKFSSVAPASIASAWNSVPRCSSDVSEGPAA